MTKQSARRVTILAALWAFAFAATNLYWGLGGTTGLGTLGEGIEPMARAQDRELMLINWISVVGKIALGIIALATMKLWHSGHIRNLLYVAICLAGVLLTLYGIGNFVQHAMMLAGTVPIARMLGSFEAVRWHLILWDPAWIFGGILFLLKANELRNTNRTP